MNQYQKAGRSESAHSESIEPDIEKSEIDWTCDRFPRRYDGLRALDEALEWLCETDAALEELVQLRIFGGLMVDDLADLLEVSAPTIKRRWKVACAWLFAQLEPA